MTNPTRTEVEAAGIEWEVWLDPESWTDKESAFFWERTARAAAKRDAEIRTHLTTLLPGTPACWEAILPKIDRQLQLTGTKKGDEIDRTT